MQSSKINSSSNTFNTTSFLSSAERINSDKNHLSNTSNLLSKYLEMVEKNRELKAQVEEVKRQAEMVLASNDAMRKNSNHLFREVTSTNAAMKSLKETNDRLRRELNRNKYLTFIPEPAANNVPTIQAAGIWDRVKKAIAVLPQYISQKNL